MEKKNIKLKTGDIISFEVKPNLYGFAKVLTQTKIGAAIEVYDYFNKDIGHYKNAVNSLLIVNYPIIIDDYSIFWKRTNGNWSLLERNPDFKYTDAEKSKIKYRYGVPGLFKLIDLNDNSYSVSQEEAEQYPEYTPYSNNAIVHRINFLLEKKDKKPNE